MPNIKICKSVLQSVLSLNAPKKETCSMTYVEDRSSYNLSSLLSSARIPVVLGCIREAERYQTLVPYIRDVM